MSYTETTVVVTGGASGIGATTAKRFADADATVVIADIDAEAAATVSEALPGRGGTLAVETDVSDADDVAGLFDRVRDRYDGIDVLVNGAGIGQSPVPTTEQTVAEWERVMDVHLKGTYLCSKHALTDMLSAESGAIINLSSIYSFGGIPYRTAYGPAKSAINNLTKTLAVEVADRGVRVNAVAPGHVLTPMVYDALEDDDHELERGMLEERTPRGQLAEPEDIATVIEFLASEGATHVTGVVLPVDGGWSAYSYL